MQIADRVQIVLRETYLSLVWQKTGKTLRSDSWETTVNLGLHIEQATIIPTEVRGNAGTKTTPSQSNTYPG